MSKHTPGPWSHRNGRIFQTDYEALTIGNVARAHDGDYSPDNGQLLAAAPELLEALKMAYAETMEYIKTNHLSGAENNCWLVLARAAITKATGETE